MSGFRHNSAPATRAVLREQIRAVRVENVRIALVVAGLLLFFIGLVVDEVILEGGDFPFHPEHWVLPAMAGLLLPFALWRGEERRGAGFFWSLPVDRRQHALLRVAAGWVWLMVVVAVFVLALLALTLVSGGQILGERTLRLLTLPLETPGGPLPPGGVREVPWTMTPLLWLAPFTGATGAYLVVSTLALGLKRPLRWLAGTFVLMLLIAVTGDFANSRRVAQVPARLLDAVMNGRWGWDALITARTESLKTEGLLPTGESVVVWRALPDLGDWAIATALWIGLGLVAVWLAASRHRENRGA